MLFFCLPCVVGGENRHAKQGGQGAQNRHGGSTAVDRGTKRGTATGV